MAPNDKISNKSMGNPDFASAEIKNVPVLPSYLCRDCGRMKTASQYSNKELFTYKYKKFNKLSVDKFSAKLRCRLCTGEQRHELKCYGPCSLYKNLDGFSKTARKNEQPWCLDCTNWKEASEPGITPIATPNGNLAPDEELEVALDERESNIFDLEGGSGSDDDYDEEAFYTATSSLYIAAAGSERTRSEVGGQSIRGARLPPHLRGRSQVASRPASSMGNPFLERTGNDENSAAGLDGSEKSKTPSLQGADRTPTASITFADARQRDASVITSTSELSTPGGRPNKEVHSGWARLPGGNRRNPPVDFPRMQRPMARQARRYDSDDSPDEM